jgi:hypothetical protein
MTQLPDISAIILSTDAYNSRSHVYPLGKDIIKTEKNTIKKLLACLARSFAH